MVAASLAGVMVLAPRFIERWERNAFARDDLRAALRASKLRELVVPGLGSTRRRRQIANLIEARQGGAAQVLRRLDDEMAKTRDADGVTTLVLERATVLFMAGRYRECIDAAAKLGARWPSEHPVLGVYLVRAHAELGEHGGGDCGPRVGRARAGGARSGRARSPDASAADAAGVRRPAGRRRSTARGRGAPALVGARARVLA